MNDRTNDQRLDALALQYLAALDAHDAQTLLALWDQAADDPELETMLHELNDEVAAAHEETVRQTLNTVVLQEIREHLPSAEVLALPTAALRVRDVAEQLRRQPPAGVTATDVAFNEQLLHVQETLPAELGLRQVLQWGAQWGTATDHYWRAFRQAALQLRLRRGADVEFQMAARSTKKPTPEDKS